MTTECPACHTDNPADETQCNYCGSDLVNEQHASPFETVNDEEYSNEALGTQAGYAVDYIDDEPQSVEEPQQEQEVVQEAAQETGDRFDHLFKSNAHSELNRKPLPDVGPYNDPATLTIFFNHQPVYTYELDVDETLIGRYDEQSEEQPELDLTELDVTSGFSRKHCRIYRQNKNYTLCVLSNRGTQLNNKILELGDERALSHGDIIVFSGLLAMKFELPL